MGLEGLSRRIISSNINKFLRMSQRRTLYSLLHAAAGNAAITRGVGRAQLLRLTARTVIMAMATRARPRPAVCLFQRPLVAAARSLGTISILFLRTVRSRSASIIQVPYRIRPPPPPPVRARCGSSRSFNATSKGI